jgi:hypothetical protein
MSDDETKVRRCKEFLACLGNGKNIYQIESELELEEWREKRERKKILDDFWGEDGRLD